MPALAAGWREGRPVLALGSSVLPAHHLVPNPEVQRLVLQRPAEPCLTGSSMMARVTKACVIMGMAKVGMALAREGAEATRMLTDKHGVVRLAIMRSYLLTIGKWQ